MRKNKRFWLFNLFQKERRENFYKFQSLFLKEFSQKPSNPILSHRKSLQTCVILEYQIDLFNCSFISIEVYKNDNLIHNGNFGKIIRLSGLDVSQEYRVYIKIQTSDGTLTSNTIKTYY